MLSSSLLRTSKVRGEASSAHHGDEAHHARAPDGLAHEALAALREARLGADFDPAHGGDEVAQEPEVFDFAAGVDVELEEHVGVAGLFASRRGLLLRSLPPVFFVLLFLVVFAVEVVWWHESIALECGEGRLGLAGRGGIALRGRELGCGSLDDIQYRARALFSSGLIILACAGRTLGSAGGPAGRERTYPRRWADGAAQEGEH